MSIESLYSQIITEHGHATHNRGNLAHATVSLQGENPSCGDALSLSLRVADARIKDACFTGSGCLISLASASIMIDLVKGKTPAEALRLADAFFSMIHAEALPDEVLEALQDAAALQGVAKLPSRAKCATLAWRTLVQALAADHHATG